MRAARLSLILGWTQGLYFFVLGLWPLLNIQSFQAITGKKTDHLVTGLESDHWLVYTVGALIASIGLTLLIAAWRKQIALEIALLAGISALTLAAIDGIYVARQVISPIYLADGASELVFVAGWVVWGALHRYQSPQDAH